MARGTDYACLLKKVQQHRERLQGGALVAGEGPVALGLEEHLAVHEAVLVLAEPRVVGPLLDPRLATHHGHALVRLVVLEAIAAVGVVEQNLLDTHLALAPLNPVVLVLGAACVVQHQNAPKLLDLGTHLQQQRDEQRRETRALDVQSGWGW